MRNFDLPDINFGQISKSIRHYLQFFFRTCPSLQISWRTPNTAYPNTLLPGIKIDGRKKSEKSRVFLVDLRKLFQ